MVLVDFKEEIGQFGKFLFIWVNKRALVLGEGFETGKDYLVKRLIWRRGTLSKPFLHTSFGIILSVGVISAPIIANTYPTIGAENKSNEETPSSVLNTATAATMGTTTQESIKPRDKIVTYIIQPGDTVSEIAKKFEICTESIVWQNNLSSANDISPGQKIEILPVCGMAHKVSAGETIYTIATKYGLKSAQPIVDFPFNNFRDDETFALNIGDEIVVPGGVKPVERPSSFYQPAYVAQLPSVAAGGNGSFIWPTSGEITQERTWYHTGLDIANNIGTTILASAPGRVIATIWDAWGYGYHVIIDHGTYQSLYGHLSAIGVKEGEDVGQGQEIGKMGSTGRSTGPHLHFEIRSGGEILSPRGFLK